jgi:CHAT domain-containing protein
VDATDWKEETEKEKQEKAEQIARRRRCSELLKTEPVIESVKAGNKQQHVQVLPFDLARAHELYQALFSQVEDLIKDKHLLIVPPGPLTSLPFNVLVTEQPQVVNASSKLSEYRTTAWLGTRQPITVLPSVASLKALRQFANPHAQKHERTSRPPAVRRYPEDVCACLCLASCKASGRRSRRLVSQIDRSQEARRQGLIRLRVRFVR